MKIVAISLLVSAAMGTAHAAEVTLSAPMSAQTLHAGGIDMSLFWQAKGDLAEISALYIASNKVYEPKRLTLALADGENVSFALPNETQVSYEFSRQGDTIQVTATRVWQEFAAAQ